MRVYDWPSERKSTPLSVNFARTNKQLLLLYRFVVGSYCY